jgi:hypothetical protein
MEESILGRRVLVKIVAKLGGAEAAAERLQIGPSLLRRFLSGSLDVPDVVLLRAVDCLHENPTAVPETPPTSTVLEKRDR